MQDGQAVIERAARAIELRIGNACPPEDLRAFGREGLLDAARTFDESRGKSFVNWAWLRVRGAMIEGVRHWGVSRSVHRQLEMIEREDEAAGRNLVKLTAIPRDQTTPPVATEPSPEIAYEDAEQLARLRAAIQRLPEKTRELVQRHYFGDEPLQDVAASIGVTKWWGSRLHARALASLSEDLADRQ